MTSVRTAQDLLQRYERENTKRLYLHALLKFFKIMGYVDSYEGDERETKLQKAKKASKEYIQDVKEGKRTARYDVEDFRWEIDDLAPNTIKGYINIVELFLGINEIYIPDKFKELNINPPKSLKITDQKTPTPEVIADILQGAPFRLQAFSLCLLSSGGRLVEIINLTFEDLALEKDPPRAYVSQEHLKTHRTKREKYLFFTEQAKRYLQRWLEEKRKKYLESKRGIRGEKDYTSKIFPFTRKTVRREWNERLRETGYDEKDERSGRYLYNLYSLKNFFAEQGEGERGEDRKLIETLMGHETKLVKAYRSFEEEQLAEMYRKVRERLRIPLKK